MIETLEDLVAYLLYRDMSLLADRMIIAVGRIGDDDISDKLSPDLRLKILNILEERGR